MTRYRAGRAAMTAIVLLAIAGCGRIGNPIEVLSAKPPAPDEFQVLTTGPLQMPTSISLPEPRPGARSPLEPNPERDAVVALLGRDTRAVAVGASAGEQALLAAANASATDPAIRQTLAAEGSAANQPYQAPLLWEIFGSGQSAAARDAIDPIAESRRLQGMGAAVPVDPNPPVASVATGEAANADLYPELGVNGPPRNKLPSSGATPAF